MKPKATIAIVCLAAFGAQAASVQYAPLSKVRLYEQVVTNVTFDAAPDFSTGNTQLVATIEATAPAPGNYAAVSNAAMTAAGYTDSATNELAMSLTSQMSQMSRSATNYTDFATNELVIALTTDDGDRQIEVNHARFANWAGDAYAAESASHADGSTYAANLGEEGSANRTSTAIFAQLDAATETNAAQSAAIAGIPAAMTNIAEAVAAEATEGLLTDESDPVWAAQKSQYATTQSVATVSANVGTLWSYVYGNSVWIAVTNYMRTVEGVSPSLQLWEVRNGVTNLVYWSKEEITNVTADLIHDCKTNLEQTVANATNAMPDKAWAKYQSATGAENPQPGDVTIVSTPSVMLTGGGEWTQYVDVGGSQVFLLQSNGLTSFGADTNGYFRVVDSDGNAQFEVKKTDSYFVDAVPSSVHFDEDHNFVATFAANTQPQLYTSENVAAAEYAAEGGDPNISVTWSSPSNGFWSATMEQTVAKPKLFCYAKVLQEGENTIVNSIPARFDGGIRIGNQTYNIGTATISGKTVLTLEAQ